MPQPTLQIPTDALKLDVLRYSDNGNSTQSLTFVAGEFFCHGLEDEHRAKKVAGETRIPNGVYEVKFREAESGLTLKYREKHPWFTYHLEVQDVPNFTYVYIHIGNTEKHTDACYLVGNTTNNNQVNTAFLGKSTAAYKRLYTRVSAHLNAGKRVFIEYKTIDANGLVGGAA